MRQLARAWALPLAGLLLLSIGPPSIALAADTDRSARLERGLAAFDRHDFPRAWALLQPLAHAGLRRAQLTVGTMYARGDGTVQDFVSAHTWLNLAAAQGSAEARRQRDELARQMTPTQIARAQSRARELAPQSTAADPPSNRVPSASPAVSGTASTGGLPSGNLTARVQKMLTELGYDPGVADGVAGRKTRLAIERYQTHSGLAVDGRVSQPLHDALAANLGYAASSPGPSSDQAAVPRSSRPPAQPVVPTAEPRLDAALAELRGLIAEARQQRSANPRFLRRLTRLADRYDEGSPAAVWRVIVSERFEDGNFDRAPPWIVQGGRFWVDDRARLRSSVSAAAEAQEERELSSEEIPLAILGAILGGARGESQGGSEARGATAVIHLPTEIPARSAVEVAFDLGSGPRHALQLSLLGAGATYHLTFDAGSPGSRARLRLLRQEAGRHTTLGDVEVGGISASSRAHLSWALGEAGMEVLLNQSRVLQVSERAASSFRGLSLSNLGGEMGVDAVEIRGQFEAR